ncbi:ANL family adenylate-forming protein [Pelosinus baikalensis]|uniref:Fatty acid--CoA ligase family protein n=1 Tax=Pelosinus baikalensis TaxID=2892015 RepID=A0ABS8HXV1_9FIRM|nr:fatty acid--CoA ligase family protein [Pelosinus baikalensis]MCC5467063.1 fatty acid--CoA ligase family protein [Pelosinus baikalensis]
MSNLSWIIDKMQEVQNDDFFILKDKSYRYLDLIKNVNTWKSELGKLGVAEGECVAIIGDYSPNVIFLLLALILNKNIIVPIGIESKEKQEEMFLVAKVNKYFEFNEDDTWSYYPVSGDSTHQLLDRLRMDNESGIIIFTSGTSGKSKAAVLCTSRLIERYKTAKRKPFRTMVFLKLDHIGGINTLFAIMFNGGTIVTSQERTPQSVCEAIQKHKVQLLPTTPTFLNMLIMSKFYENYDLSSLEIITYGTEPMPQSTLASMNSIFPSVTLKQTYGLTELGIFSTKSKDSHSKWMKVGGRGVEMKIVDNILWIRTSAAMLGYLNAPSPFDNDGWYNTGDQVEVDGEYIKILGRKSEIINVGGEKVYPTEVESVLLEILNIKDVLVSGKNSPITGQIVVATVVLNEPEEIKDVRKRIIDYCKERLLPYKIPTLIMVSDKELVSERFKKMRSGVAI